MIKFLFTILLIFSLHSCGTLITSLITPSTVATSVADYKIEQETGKKVSEHLLSFVTKKDCKFTLEIKNICKENAIAVVENNRTRDLVKNALKKQD